MARGGTQGGLNCPTHALPRCLPTPTEEADGNGYGVIAGRGGPSRPPPRASVNLVPLLLTGVRLHPPGRTDKNLCRCFGAPACRVFPDHLITSLLLYGAIAGWSDPLGRSCSTYLLLLLLGRRPETLVPLLLTGVRLHPPGRTDKHLCRCFGAPATHARRPHGRVFPDHLIKRGAGKFGITK